MNSVSIEQKQMAIEVVIIYRILQMILSDALDNFGKSNHGHLESNLVRKLLRNKYINNRDQMATSKMYTLEKTHTKSTHEEPTCIGFKLAKSPLANFKDFKAFFSFVS